MDSTITAGPVDQLVNARFISCDPSEKAALALRLAEAWPQNPQLTLLWTTPEAYAEAAKSYQQCLLDQAADKAARGGLTLAEADERISHGIPALKAALLAKYKKGHDRAIYGHFGIITRDDGYQLPRRYSERAKALQTLLKGLADHGMEGGDCGKAFWEPIVAAYCTGEPIATASLSGSLASPVPAGYSASLEAQVTQVLIKMLVLLEAQYPNDDERAAKRHELGYDKEYH
jgi:hypothetical protein